MWNPPSASPTHFRTPRSLQCPPFPPAHTSPIYLTRNKTVSNRTLILSPPPTFKPPPSSTFCPPLPQIGLARGTALETASAPPPLPLPPATRVSPPMVKNLNPCESSFHVNIAFPRVPYLYLSRYLGSSLHTTNCDSFCVNIFNCVCGTCIYIYV